MFKACSYLKLLYNPLVLYPYHLQTLKRQIMLEYLNNAFYLWTQSTRIESYLNIVPQIELKQILSQALTDKYQAGMDHYIAIFGIKEQLSPPAFSYITQKPSGYMEGQQQALGHFICSHCSNTFNSFQVSH